MHLFVQRKRAWTFNGSTVKYALMMSFGRVCSGRTLSVIIDRNPWAVGLQTSCWANIVAPHAAYACGNRSTAEQIRGHVDTMKLHSCTTLFATVDPVQSDFGDACAGIRWNT